MKTEVFKSKKVLIELGKARPFFVISKAWENDQWNIKHIHWYRRELSQKVKTWFEKNIYCKIVNWFNERK